MERNFDRIALASGTRLHWYEVRAVCGRGGFGITYLAQDTNTRQQVAIKEYLPSQLVQRADGGELRPTSPVNEDEFRWGLERFLTEAETLSRFDHPSIVRVHTVFELNGTAYMVMRYEHGRSLDALLNEQGTLGAAELEAIVVPILDGLAQVHEAGYIHRDIKPENILTRDDGGAVLLDFGSARQALGRRSQSMTRLVSPGYAPLEQYAESAEQQGPWTDIYGLGATLYHAVTGKPPVDAVQRSKGVLGSTRDILPKAAEAVAGRYPAQLLNAIDHALMLKETDRPQRISTWKHELFGGDATPTMRLDTAPPPRGRARARWLEYALVAAVVAGATVLLAEHGPDWRGERARSAESVRAAQEKERAAQQLADAIAAREEKLRSAEAALAERQTAIAARERVLVESTRSIQRDSEDLAQERGRLSSRRAELEALGAELAAVQQERGAELSAREARVVNEERALARREAMLAAQEEALEASRSTARRPVAARPPSGVSPPAVTEVDAPDAAPLTLREATVRFDAGRFDQSVPALVRFAEAGDASARYRVALAKLDGTGLAKDPAGALSGLTELAESGDPEAQHELGRIYEDGKSVERDYEAARRWYLQAAQRGHARAQFAYGRTYELERGVKKDYFYAYIWYALAVQCGYPDAEESAERSERRLQPHQVEIARRSIQGNRIRYCGS